MYNDVEAAAAVIGESVAEEDGAVVLSFPRVTPEVFTPFVSPRDIHRTPSKTDSSPLQIRSTTSLLVFDFLTLRCKIKRLRDVLNFTPCKGNRPRAAGSRIFLA